MGLPNERKISFNELIEYLGENLESEKLAKRLNKLIRNKGLKLYFGNPDIFPIALLPEKKLSEVAYETNWPVLVINITEISVSKKSKEDFTYENESFISFDEVEFEGMKLHTAMKGMLTNRGLELPERLNVVVCDESSFKSYFLPRASKDLVSDFYLLENDFKAFKLVFERDKASGVREKRLSVLKNYLVQKGYDVSQKISNEEHDFTSRQSLWDELIKFDPEIFKILSEDTVNKFFNKNPYISFSE